MPRSRAAGTGVTAWPQQPHTTAVPPAVTPYGEWGWQHQGRFLLETPLCPIRNFQGIHSNRLHKTSHKRKCHPCLDLSITNKTDCSVLYQLRSFLQLTHFPPPFSTVIALPACLNYSIITSVLSSWCTLRFEGLEKSFQCSCSEYWSLTLVSLLTQYHHSPHLNWHQYVHIHFPIYTIMQCQN